MFSSVAAVLYNLQIGPQSASQIIIVKIQWHFIYFVCSSHFIIMCISSQKVFFRLFTVIAFSMEF